MLLIDKPIGPSSFNVVATVKQVLGIERVGHAGTLDPLATGLLIVLVGREETKQQDYFMKLDKEYIVTIELGKLSTTDDREGEITSTTLQMPNLKQFIGEIKQTPPAYSAIHVQGERAYRLARQGKPVTIAPRSVTIYSIELLDYEKPFITLKVNCSHGTYIRSLARAMGGYVIALRRTRIGDYDVSTAISLDQIAISKNQPLKRE